ncbi:hypothetical protein AB6G19_13445 [Providencia manganoxydans]|uniref:hypothetical protein n=1 Tax=Providencia manganoxydans TaxID=2923283 RepID=UPI0034DD48F9
MLGGIAINNKRLLAANAENKVRLSILNKAYLKYLNNKYYILFEKMKSCERRYYCNSLACAVCVNRIQKEITYKYINYLGNDYIFVTLIFYRDKIPVIKLSKFNPARLKDKLRKKLKAIGFDKPIFGSLEIDLHLYKNKGDSYYLPHFHLLMPNEQLKFKKLRDYMKSNSNLQGRIGVKNRPMLVKRIDNLEGIIRYITKFMWCEIPWYLDNKGKLTHGSKRRISNNRLFADSLIRLDKLKISDLLFKCNFQ